MEEMNSDGAGIAWRENGKVKYEKGIDHKRMWKIIKTIDLPFIVHFRIKSSGSICDELTHPFEVCLDVPDKLQNSCDKVLFHNGTVTQWQDKVMEACINQGLKIPDGHLSDSKALSFLCAVYGDNYLKLLTSQSRFTIFTNTQILKYGDWKEVSGGICSNDHHVPTETIKTDWSQGGYKPNSEWYEGKFRTQKEIEDMKALKLIEIQNNHKSETSITIYSKDVTKHVRNDGLLNVWSKNNVLLYVENAKGLIIKDYRASKDKSTVLNTVINKAKEVKLSEQELNDQIDALNIFDMTDEEQKELYSKTTIDLIKLDAKLHSLQQNLTLLEENKDILREDKRKAKIRSTKNRIEKAVEKQIFYTTILDDIMQNQDDINHDDQVTDIMDQFPERLIHYNDYGMY